MSSKTHFYRDYFALESWACQHGIAIACHHTVKFLITQTADRYPDNALVAPYVEKARGIVYYPPNDLREKFRDAGNILWLTVGASICGITLKESDLAGSVNRWVGVADCSAFNGGYSGISIYQWKNKKLTRTGWLFKDGVLEPREPDTAPLQGLI
jgi:hypothetical protein